MHWSELEIKSSLWVEGKILWGKKLAQEIRHILKSEIIKYEQKPGLAAILVGDNSASEIYVSQKEKAAREAGFYSVVEKLSKDTEEKTLLNLIHSYNQNKDIHGILVQLPLPSHLNEKTILQNILPEKDADGFHYVNLGKLFAKDEGTIPCTPLGILLMLRLLKINTAGLHAVVLGRSNIVGKPMAALLLNYLDCTVTICHSKTKELKEIVKGADILVSAMGKRGVVPSSWIKEGALVFDVGIHRTPEGICGDLDFETAKERASYITPVPGGVGPMTIAMLLYNTFQNFKKIYGRS